MRERRRVSSAPNKRLTLLTTSNEGMRMTQKLAVVILAAGQGTRMKSAVPKILHRIGGKALISHVLDTAAGLQPEIVIAVVRHEREQVSQAILDHAPHTLIVGIARIGGTDYRYKLYRWDGQAYSRVESIDTSLPVLFKPMGTPRPEPVYIASDAD